MRQDRLTRLHEIESNHFWFTARRRIVAHACAALNLTSPTVIDAGCGTGATLTALFDNSQSIGIDPIYPAAASALELSESSFVRGRTEALPVRNGVADLVLALDVLEHVDDATALDEIQRVLKPGSHVVATVPAYPALWSYRDDDAGHLRRYRTSTIRSVVEHSGFEVIRCSFFHGALLPLLVVSRLFQRRESPTVRDIEDRPPPIVNRVLSRATAAEAFLAERELRPPFGSSLLIIARRPL